MDTQEIMTTALRAEAAKALGDASYAIKRENASIHEVRELVARAITALELAMQNVEQKLEVAS